MNEEPKLPNAEAAKQRAGKIGLAATAIIPINAFIIYGLRANSGGLILIFAALALLQGILGFVAFIILLRSGNLKGKWIAAGIFFSLVGLGGVFAIVLPFLFIAMGGGWGRPLRIRGRVVHPELTVGTDWSAGKRPNGSDLDPDTRLALAALWLHDAQKEHASVPAFSRLSWQLTAVGAPPKLLAEVHRAALEEIDHAQKCFALAEGYGGTAFTVETMPELLVGGLGIKGNAFSHLATESFLDGCLLEDFNADVAAACAKVCEEPVTRGVLLQIAKEERSHAELSWRVVNFCIERGGSPVIRTLEKSLRGVRNTARPTAVSSAKAALVAKANEADLKRHGRLPDSVWGNMWEECLDKTIERMASILERSRLHVLIRNGSAYQTRVCSQEILPEVAVTKL